MHSSLSAIQLRVLGSLVLLLAILSLGRSSSVHAQQAPAQRKQTSSRQGKPVAPAQPTPTPRNSAAIDIKVETVRKQIVPGTPMAVTADITNNSEATVYFRERDLQLVLPTEIEISTGGNATAGWLPTEDCVENCPQSCPSDCGPSRVIALKTKETYRVFWNKTKGTTQWYKFFNFTPGTYPISVEAKYWDTREFGGDDYHTVVETKTVEFTAPQSIILLGAVLGGLIFTALSAVRPKETAADGAPLASLHAAKGLRKWLRKLGKGLLIIFGSVLLSVIITILLSRIQETQFFIKVTVSDFWGAIAVGFLANYGGNRLLDKIIPGGDKDDKIKRDKTKEDQSTKGQTQTATDTAGAK